MAEHVILFAGPMGAGKTTAVEALSEIEMVRTEAGNTDRETADKATTTVALDYGEITLDEEDKVRLYGVPGQKRFDFMWSILKERARGLILLVHNDAPDSIDQMIEYLDEFAELDARGGVVIGVTRSDLELGPPLDDYSAALRLRRPELVVPVYTVDPRDQDQMRTMLMTLIANIEIRAMLAPRSTRPAGGAA
ncbi:GTP-binding protein [Homoserinibacter sp. YIM 151385]|uniref:GTP-binding protein n=1 Tax=Homoserinibacter sp. YIM 151385 TaxID=2985506 RepID=UPI0022F0009A|nr:ATP/GTP-binding protein [Homoserinibacter sp. YIM 151385]WBU39210.1 ATP/GTP-binding protein [Homoserinibacter sp. YIM 151385]